MKALIQRVTRASLSIEQKVHAEIDQGLLVLLGIGPRDSIEEAKKLLDKIFKLRIFADEAGKTSLSVQDVKGSVLIASQFTLYADCKKGNRPSFTKACAPDKAKALYEDVLNLCTDAPVRVVSGVFGADMQISLVNDGPFTIMLDTDEL